MEYDTESNNISSCNRDQNLTESHLSQLFSIPMNWSLDSAFICNSGGLRYLAVVPKMLRKGIDPMYMADPSESGQPAANTEGVPDWLLEFRREKTESVRKHRAKAAKGKKSPLPSWLRVKQCRERKARIAPAESTIGTISSNSMYV
jgi:hypothetical protein